MTPMEFVFVLAGVVFLAMMIWDWGYRVAQRDKLSMDELEKLARVEECRDAMYKSVGLLYEKPATYWRKLIQRRKDKVTKPVQS